MAMDYRTRNPISIHAPREGSDWWLRPAYGCTPRYFYPRSPRGERLAGLEVRYVANAQFLSTLPARGATISTSESGVSIGYFYPRSPRGERPATPTALTIGFTFLSTLPARGATLVTLNLNGKRSISIHAPREGSDKCICRNCIHTNKFLSTLPARGATNPEKVRAAYERFLSTLPARGATWMAR